MDSQRRVNLRRNLPAELKMEIVDCLPLGNVVHFLANVPNRLIIHHCAPRVRRMLKMIAQIVTGYARTLPAANSDGRIWLENGHKYTPEMDIFLRYGAADCCGFYICCGTSPGFVGYPANFFNNLIQHYYQTKVPTKAIPRVGIALTWEKPTPWPAALVHSRAGEMNVEELEVHNDVKCAEYILLNKHNSGIAFRLTIFFQGEAKCYKQMTNFLMSRA